MHCVLGGLGTAAFPPRSWWYVRSASVTDDKRHSQWRVSGIGPVYPNCGQIWIDSKRKGLLPPGFSPVACCSGPGASGAAAGPRVGSGAGRAMPMATFSLFSSDVLEKVKHWCVWWGCHYRSLGRCMVMGAERCDNFHSLLMLSFFPLRIALPLGLDPCGGFSDCSSSQRRDHNCLCPLGPLSGFTIPFCPLSLYCPPPILP